MQPSVQEIELGRRFTLAGGELEVRLQRDEVNADFSGGGDVPYYSSENVLAFDYTRGMTNALLEIQDVESRTRWQTSRQQRMASHCRMRACRTVWKLVKRVLVISAYGRNLTDEVARNHICKNEVLRLVEISVSERVCRSKSATQNTKGYC